jgi:hypothetical protein
MLGRTPTTPQGEAIDLTAIALGLATSPLTGWLLTAFGSLLLAAWLRSAPLNRARAQAFADYLEAIERQAVLAAELAGFVKGLRGHDKLLFALEYVQARLAEQGIVGNPDSVTCERLMADLERLKEDLFPGKGTLVNHLAKPKAS